MAKEDKYNIILGLELASRALADYFSFKQEGKSDEDVAKEFVISFEKKTEDKKKTLSLRQMIEDFTYSFLGSKDIKGWTSKESVNKMPDARKYALKLVGKHVKGNEINMPEEQRGLKYIVSNLRYLRTYKSDDEKLRKESLEKLYKFFGRVAEIAAEEAGAIEFPKKKL